MKKLSAGLLTLFLSSSYAFAAPKVEHFVFHYESGDVFDVQIADNTITWKGIEGADKGHSETDNINRKQLTDDVEVMQWVETSGTALTLVLDRTHLKTISSGKAGNESFLWSGRVEVK